MRSLRQQVLVLMLASLVLLAASFIIILGWHMRERAISAAIIKAQSDLATCTEIIDLKYPGNWQVLNGILYKGKSEISHQNELVDSLSQLTGDTVTIFLNDTRVATTVRGIDGQRAIGTKVSDAVGQKVLKNGEVYLGEANVVGQLFQTAYEPLHDANGNIVGMFYVGISRSYTQEMIANSLGQTAALGAGLTLIVGLLAWLFIEKVIIRPLRNITLGTRDLATGHITEKVDVSGPKEIGELASAFNQMIERLESVAKGFAQYEKENTEKNRESKLEKEMRGAEETGGAEETRETGETKISGEAEETGEAKGTEGAEETKETEETRAIEETREIEGARKVAIETERSRETEKNSEKSRDFVSKGQAGSLSQVEVERLGEFEARETGEWVETSSGVLKASTENKLEKSLSNWDEKELPKGLNKGTLFQITRYLTEHPDFVSAEDVAEGVKLTRVTVRRYLEFLEQCDLLTSELKYGMVGRPVRLWHIR